MTTLFSARRRADEFAAAIDDPQRDVDAELRALVRVVSTMRGSALEHPDASPRAEFAADLRARLMAEADQVMVPGAPLALPPRTVGRRERHLVAAASALVVLGGSAGMAAASQGALPGDTLYPVKRGLERAEAGLSVSSAGKGRDLLHQAGGRLAEVEGLLADDRAGSAPRIPAALDDFVDQADQGADLLLDSFRETRDPATVDAVRSFAADSISTLQDIAREAPESAQPGLNAAALALRDIDLRAAALCSTCAAGVPTVELPRVLLAAAEADRALTDLDPGTLDNSHPFVVPKSMTPGPRSSQGPRGTGTGGGSGSTGSAGSGGSTGGTTDALPETGTPSVPDDGDAAESGGKKVADTVEEVGEGVDDTVGQITDGLTGVVETVLPDPIPDTGTGTGGGTGLLP